MIKNKQTKNLSELKTISTEMKNTLKGINSRSDDAEKCINNQDSGNHPTGRFKNKN